MEELHELFAKREFHSLISYAQSKLSNFLPEAQHILYGAIGRAHFELAEYPAAVAALDKAIALNPRYAAGLRTRGQSYIEQGEYQLAVTDLLEAMGADPQLDANDYLGYAYASLGQQEQAIAAYSAYLKAGMDAWVLARRAEALAALRRFAEARNDWETILAAQLADPQHLRDIADANRVNEQGAFSISGHYRDKPLSQLLTAEGFADMDVDEVSRKHSALLGAGIYVLEFSGETFMSGKPLPPSTDCKRTAGPTLT